MLRGRSRVAVQPLLAAIRRLVERGVLPAVRRFTFDNDAADEHLDVDHWFWDSTVSGGIFLEHGVHFFDAATMLIGTSPFAVTGVASGRTNGIVDTVVAVASHPDGVLATHTHSFTHANRCERQHMRLDHGRAETRIEGWIPLRADIELWTDADGFRSSNGVLRTCRTFCPSRASSSVVQRRRQSWWAPSCLQRLPDVANR